MLGCDAAGDVAGVCVGNEQALGRDWGEWESGSGSGSGRTEAGAGERERESRSSGRVGVGHAVQVTAPALHPQQGTLVGYHGPDPVGGEHVALRVQSLVVEVQREVEAVILEHDFRFVVDVVRLLHPEGCHSIHLHRQVVVLKPGVET